MDPRDKNGILAFNAKAEFNLKFFTFVNTEYPKRMRELAYQNKKLEERNRQVKIRIMTEEEVKALSKPQKTLGGDYKISPKKYQNLLATAKRVDLAEHNQRVLRDKEQRLQEKEADLEKKQRLPIPERIELSALRKMKTIVEKIVSYISMDVHF